MQYFETNHFFNRVIQEVWSCKSKKKMDFKKKIYSGEWDILLQKK